MPENLHIHQKFIAILLPSPAPLAALAAGRIRSSVTKGACVGRVDPRATWTR